MKIEFHPDFKVHPVFKAIWPRLKEMLRGVRFEPENDRNLVKKISLSLGAIVLLAVVVVLAIKLLKPAIYLPIVTAVIHAILSSMKVLGIKRQRP